jgi:ABC-2 type transport system permease protein
MIGKIIGTSLAGILQFFIWALIGLYCLPHLCFELTGPTASFSRINGTGAARIWYRPNVYQGIMEFTNSEYTNKFYSLFHRWLLSLQLFMAIGAVDNQTDSQQFLLPIMPLVLSVYVGF